MNTIGTKDNGDKIVEMSRVEHQIFTELQDVCKGKLLYSGDFPSNSVFHDLHPVFMVIKSYAVNKSRILDLKKTVERFEQLLS